MKNKKTFVSIQVPLELKEALKRKAKRQGRTLSSYVRMLFVNDKMFRLGSTIKRDYE